MSIPIFCINLERATERKEKIKKEWIDKLELDIVFWKAYDRRQIEQKKYIYEYKKTETIKTFGRELNDGEIACATSYCLLYEHLINSNIQEAIFMEDDITPLFTNNNTLFWTISEGKKEFPNAGLMLLHSYRNSYKIDKKKCKIGKVFSCCNPPPWGNQLFYANIGCIKKLYGLLNKMLFPADYPQRILANTNEAIYINNHLCKHHWIGNDATTYIGNTLRGTHRYFIQ